MNRIKYQKRNKKQKQENCMRFDEQKQNIQGFSS